MAKIETVRVPLGALAASLNPDGTPVDVVVVVAARVFNVPEDKVTQEQRRRAKPILFRHLYSGSFQGAI